MFLLLSVSLLTTVFCLYKNCSRKDNDGVTIIVACTSNGGIGHEGGIPWQIREDMRHFKKTTMGSTVIMGRNTWESLPPSSKPLKGRNNIVVTSDPLGFRDSCDYNYAYEYVDQDDVCKIVYSLDNEGIVTTVNSLEAAIEEAYDQLQPQPIFIIGGSQIYNRALKMDVCKKIICTNVLDHYICDRFIDNFDDFELSKEGLVEQSDDGPYYQINEFRRKNVSIKQ